MVLRTFIYMFITLIALLFSPCLILGAVQKRRERRINYQYIRMARASGSLGMREEFEGERNMLPLPNQPLLERNGSLVLQNDEEGKRLKL